jgi:dephospho-CoA kinase
MKTGIAGGIGSGKSYVCKLLAKRGINVYDCDDAAKRLMRTDEQLKEQLTKLIGPQTYVDGRLNKAAVATFLLSSEANAHAIDAIVHPAVFRDFEESGLLWMESAIMFESGADRYVDNVVVVTAPEEVRIERIMKRDGISREKAQEWMQRQWPQEKVRQLAQYEIINDGRQDLDSQIADLLQKLSNTRNTHQLL